VDRQNDSRNRVSTFQAKIQGGLGKFVPGIIAVSATSAADTYRAQSEIVAILRDGHRLTSSADDDFSVRNLTELASAQQQGTKALTGLLAAIASFRWSWVVSAS